MNDSKTPTVADFFAVAEAELLRRGGVDNWDWYSESLEDYTEQKDQFADAHEFLRVLENNGVDNWTWYDECHTGLAEYEEYLQDLDEKGQVADALFFDAWKELDAIKPEPVAVEPEPVVETPKLPQGVGAQNLYDYIVSLYGEAEALTIFHAAVDARVWAINTFKKEYKKAIDLVKNGGTLEDARISLIEQTKKNGALKKFLAQVVENL
jgi:hypothetical protein